MINLIMWLLSGALVGWLASVVMATDAQQGALLNMVVGIIGAMLGGFLFGGPTINSSTFNLTALIISFIGAIILLAIVKLIRGPRISPAAYSPPKTSTKPADTPPAMSQKSGTQASPNVSARAPDSNAGLNKSSTSAANDLGYREPQSQPQTQTPHASTSDRAARASQPSAGAPAWAPSQHTEPNAQEEERQQINSLLRAHRRRLHLLEEERALKGFDTSATVKIEIEDIKAKIDDLLRQLGTLSQ
jgi:uncharacterized membrane protein YeaQ/YmgE (transglycosylase-associated protein family)